MSFENCTMQDFEGFQSRLRASRRHLMKMGAIAAAVTLSKIAPAAAKGDPNPFPTQDPNTFPPPQNPSTNTLLPDPPTCFLKGTRIRTVDGDRNIEDLAVGDLLPTVFGGTCPIQEISRFRHKKGDPAKAWNNDTLPVRIARSALASDVPHADLCVTKAHALLIDGALVTAGSLINGTTIALYDARELDELEFFHITLGDHNVIYAEGAPCETLLDDAACVPVLSFNGGRSEIKSRFRSALSPWIDRRQKLDVIRDGLEERGFALSRQAATMS